MIRASRYRRVSLLVLACYLASGTTGALVHEHLHHHGHDHAHAAGLDHCHEHHAEHAHEALPDHDHEQDEPALHADDCVVCRLAGQRTTPLATVDPPARVGQCQTLTVLAASSPALWLPGIAQPRAPPALG